MPMTNQILTPTEARIVGVLMEKQRTVPDTYPMSLAALVAGCNQKTARDPVMSLNDQDALVAIASLRQRDMVIESSGSRVLRYEQNAGRVLKVPSNGMILLAVLVLRGPQTVAELRANSLRWYAFVDASSVEAYLNELAERADGPLVVRMPRQPGARESRWTHLLSGEVEMPAVSEVRAVSDSPMSAPETSRIAALEARVEALESQVTQLLDLVTVPGSPDV